MLRLPTRIEASPGATYLLPDRDASGTCSVAVSRPHGWRDATDRNAVEPRATYRRLRGSSVPWAGRTEDPDHPHVWAIVCFAVRLGYRRQGLTRPLTDAAVEYARVHGATAVEGYPMVAEPGQDVSWGR